MEFSRATGRDAEEGARLINGSRYFPRTSTEHFTATFCSDIDPKLRGAYYRPDACLLYHLHPYAGYICWVACPAGLVDHCLDFLDTLIGGFGADSYGVVSADKFPALTERLESRGFTLNNEEIYQSLMLQNFACDQGDALLAALELQGFRFLTLNALIDDVPQGLRSLYELELEVASDIPNLPISSRPSYEDFVKDLERYRAHHPYGVAALKDGQVAAAAQHREGQVGYFLCAGTGVRRHFRRQGLALATKLAALRRMRQAGGVQVDTCNDSHNLPMLNINRKLGFQPLGRQFLHTRPKP